MLQLLCAYLFPPLTLPKVNCSTHARLTKLMILTETPKRSRMFLQIRPVLFKLHSLFPTQLQSFYFNQIIVGAAAKIFQSERSGNLASSDAEGALKEVSIQRAKGKVPFRLGISTKRVSKELEIRTRREKRVVSLRLLWGYEI